MRGYIFRGPNHICFNAMLMLLHLIPFIMVMVDKNSFGDTAAEN